ncbi:CotS family spore coat protein [Hathewaya limosa]|uniref:CotS family spore coat protein n=1 Tax=Hathewaya limosa TaxID=1536 RepID=A0ABU0JMS6_HATLI|nr:CotS family spore coat protein [Hathewaya limosa]MDQ0478364.1 CotS family spore coat protein [Hathewaya limosa]
MLDTKYKDREYLKEYCLDVELFLRFDLDVIDVIPVRKVFIVITKDGQYILKKLDYSIENLEFINNGLEYVRKNGFNNVLRFLKTKENQICTEYKGNMYCIMELLEGSESVYSNPIDVLLATKSLGLLHKASKGYYGNLEEKDFRGNLKENLQKQLQDMKFIKNTVEKYLNKNNFDNIFLENIDHLLKRGEDSLSYLLNSNYHNMINDKNKVAFCHHDLAHHNILIKDNEAYFIDFDYAIIDLKVHDLCNFILKVIKDFAYDIEKAEDIINEYKKYNDLEKDELEVLYGFMSFPHKTFTLIRNYYYKQKKWEYDIFVNKLIDKTQYIREEEEFLELFKERII